jgi:putative flavoprotein involved in K+ transport
MGIFDDTVESVPDIKASRNMPSLQLVGRPDRRSLDVATLRRQGIRLTGRLVAGTGFTVAMNDEVIATTVASDLKLAQLRTRIDAFVERSGLSDVVEPAEPFEPTWPAAFDATAERRALEALGSRSILWATGCRRKYPWLKVPVLDRHGEIRHQAGVTPAAGLYVLGMHLQRRRKSAFIDGVGDDARHLAEHIARGMSQDLRRTSHTVRSTWHVARSTSHVARGTSPVTGDSSWPPISIR